MLSTWKKMGVSLHLHCIPKITKHLEIATKSKKPTSHNINSYKAGMYSYTRPNK